MAKKNCVERLIDCAGTGRGAVVEAARLCGTYRQTVANWKRKGYIPSNWALTVEQATNGKINAAEILKEYEEHCPRLHVDHPHAIG